ncbi:MAG: cytochrome c biogenesis protein ResB [Bdellovibrionota bacterium]
MKKNPLFRFFSSVRFAIPVLFCFAAGMIYGTIQESLHGAEYAGATVYQSWWFHLVQFSIALSVLLAMVARFPYRSRLTGFYIVHIGLLTIIAGSVITKNYGIDGSVELNTHEIKSAVRLSRDLLYARTGETSESFPLPETAGAVDLNRTLPLRSGVSLRLLRYIPFAEESSEWTPQAGAWASVWRLKNNVVTQNLTLGNELAGHLERTQDLGPLHVEVVDEALAREIQVVTAHGSHGLLFVDSVSGKSYAIPDASRTFRFRVGEESASLEQVTNRKVNITFFKALVGKQHLAFLPRFSPYPITDHMQADPSSRFKLFSLENLGAANSVFLAPVKDKGVLLVYGKGRSWQSATMSSPGEGVTLPWMGFRLELLEEHRNEAREISYNSAPPHRDDEQPLKALRVEVLNGNRMERRWVSNRAETDSSIAGAILYLGAREVSLPFSLQLDHFKMDNIPGTDQPATYESFVKVKEPASGAATNAHIYMNHPMKRAGYTFYQSSYLQDENGEFHTILSVNKDPGRPVKYAGALLLVFGLVLHFLILHGKVKLG